MRARPAGNSCCTQRHCRVIPTTAIPSPRRSRPPKASPVVPSSGPTSIRAIAATTYPIHAAFLSLASAAVSSCDQARAATSLRDRSSHRTYENRRPPRPLLTQGPRRRCDQRDSERSWLQPPPGSRLAVVFFALHLKRAFRDGDTAAAAQTSLLTAD